MPTLPTPGSDAGTWGTILNDFLEVSLNSNGTLKTTALTAAGGVTNVNGIKSSSGTVTLTPASIGAGTYSMPSGGIPSTDLTSSVQTDLTLASTSLQLGGDIGGTTTAPTVSKLQGTSLNAASPVNDQVLSYSSSGNEWVPATVSNTPVNDATSSAPGLIQLSGDLGNTATSPEVVSTHLSSPLPIGQGGTGQTTQTFVNLAGDLGNSVVAPRVESIQGVSISGTPSSGQVMTATGSSAANWQTPASAPVNSVFGRTGVVVASSGDYTASQVTNALSSTTVTTKGDLLAATGSSTITRLGVGTDGQVLTAASGQSTGIQWATAASAPVTSVAGRTGAIVLAEADITNLTTDIAARVQLGGDLGNSTTTPKVESIQGVGITGTPSNGQVLTATGSSAATWSTPSGGSGNATSIDGVTVTGSPSAGQVITATSGSAANWQTVNSGSGSSTLAGDTDVSISSPANNQLLTYNTTAGKWENQTLAGITDWLNVVTQYGADPTGTNDSTTAIQNAINAVQSQSIGGSKGGVIYFPTGKYKVSSALSITSENITLLGDGGGSEFYGNPVKITQSSTTANALTVSNAWNIIIKGISFAGPGSGSGYGLHLTYTSEPAGFNAFEDVYITGFGADGLYVNGTVMSTFTRVWSTANTGYGINVSGTTCTFNSCWAPGNTAGGWFVSGTYHSWNACGADGNTGPGWTLSGCQGCNISGSGSEDNTGTAIWLTASCYACTINGFWCSNTSTGLQVDASCFRIIVSGFLEDPLSGAQYSIKIASGAIVTLIDPQVTTATSIPTSYVNQLTDNGMTVSGTLSGGTVSGKVVDATGITGATAASRYVGATTSGAPASGTFALGDFVIDQTAKIWVCTTAGAIGSGGVFTQVTGGGSATSIDGVTVTGTPSANQALIASSSSAATWSSFIVAGIPTVFNVKDAAYGATGNGSTDDTSAIQSAITACTSAGGGIIYFPVGTYLISSTLTINADMIEIEGAGWGSIISAASGLANSAMIHYEGGSTNFRFGCRIANLQLIGNSVTGVSGIQLDSTYYAKIDYVSITYCPATTVYLNGSSSYFGAYTHIIHCVIGQGGSGTGILTNNHEFNTVEATVINWFNATGGTGVNWTGGNNIMVGCTLDECQTGVVCSFSKENTFSSCEFDRAYITFIYLEAAIDCTISNCYFGDFKGTGTQSIITNNNNSGACTVSGCVTLPGTGWTNFVDEAYGTFTTPNLYNENQVGSYGFVLNSGQGANTSIVRNNIGYNPHSVTTPSFPTTTVTYTNTTGVDVMAYLTNGTAAMTTQVNGGTGPSLALSATASIFIPACGTFKATYASGSPSWVFVGN